MIRSLVVNIADGLVSLFVLWLQLCSCPYGQDIFCTMLHNKDSRSQTGNKRDVQFHLMEMVLLWKTVNDARFLQCLFQPNELFVFYFAVSFLTKWCDWLSFIFECHFCVVLRCILHLGFPFSKHLSFGISNSMFLLMPG